jgi:integrase
MAGSIRKRADRGPDAYELRVFVGRDAYGRVRHKSRIFHGTRRAAERELARLVIEQDAKPVVVPDDTSRSWGPSTTLNDAIAGWRDNGWQDLSPSTTIRYQSMWRKHIEPTIGRRKVTSLGPYDVEVYLRQMKERGLSEATVRQIRAVLHRACRLARKWSGNVLPNPVSGTEMPEWHLDEQTAAVRSPTVDEVRALLAAARKGEPQLLAFVSVIAASGIRRGEACALRWRDIDFEAGSILVDESIVAAAGGAVVKAPKTRASVRRLALDKVTMATLGSLAERSASLAGSIGFEVSPDHFVFARELPGVQPPHPDTMSKTFAQLRERAGVDNVLHLHSLRHFQATALDTVISERQKQARLGWSTVHMARHYTDGVTAEDRRAAQHIGRLLAGEPVRRAPKRQTPETSSA